MISNFQNIKILDPKVANKIAAGEVIERPAAVVKELVENSLDSDAKSVDILVSEGGKKLIRVSDNGFGIAKDEIKLSLLRHATSKVTQDDLLNIETFGFRGEALPSIAAVSQLRIASQRYDQDMAFELSVDFGDITDFKPVSRESGTSVAVSNLFSNVPARLKFLKSERSENLMIVSAVKRLALSRPDVSFTMTLKDASGARKIMNFPAFSADDLKLRIAAVLGAELTDNSFEIVGQNDKFQIEGFASIPTFSRGNATNQYFFVNGRPIYDKGLSFSLKNAFGDFLPKSRYCSAVIKIKCDSQNVDINVHPTKEEVRFATPGDLNKLIISAIRDGIVSSGAKPSTILSLSTREAFQRGYSKMPSEHLEKSSTYAVQDVQLMLNENISDDVELSSVKSLDQSTGLLGNFQNEMPAEKIGKDQFPPLGFAVAQIHENYIVSHTLDGMILVDQHAAHERLNYEKLKEEYYKFSKNKIQNLLVPEIVELGETDAELLLASKEQLADFGLEIESFGPGTVSISAIPAVLGEVNIKELVKDLLREIGDLGKEKTLLEKIDEVLSTIACHSSIRAGKILSIEEMNALLRQMEIVPYSGQCNHGRPTFIKLSLKDIQKLFGRS